MKYEFKAITVEELQFKMNNIRFAPNERLDIKPQFSRQVRRFNNNDKLRCVALSVKIESTEAAPKPFDINATYVGVFELSDIQSNDDERKFVIEATSLLYPYLRAGITNLTSAAYISPLNLPIINGPIFPEDRPAYAFSVDSTDLN